ncbi:MAG: PorT family protein [Prevotellaceae bacterium]|jgi:hypothetical protein|nr:PorT family protein [Prevotellaceae bacterium]
MTKKILLIAACLFSFGLYAKSPTSQEIIQQLLRNAHGGVELHSIDGRTSYSGFAGTGYVHYFYKEKAYIKPEISVKWGEYKYSNNYHVKTTSLAVPVTVGYQLFQEKLIGMNIFGGVRYEQILHSSDNNNSAGKLNTSQAGLTAGTSIRLANAFSINASYYYGLTTLFRDGSGRISSFGFSFNF